MPAGGQTARAEPILLGAPGSVEQVGEISRLSALALASTGLFGLALSGIIHFSHTHVPGYHGGLFVAVEIAALVGAATFRLDVYTLPLLKAGYFLAVAAMGVAVYAAGPVLAPAVAMLFMWFGCVVVGMSRRLALTVMASVGVTYAVVLVLQRGNVVAFSRWQASIVPMVVFAFVSDRLVARSWALSDSEQNARAESEQARAELEIANNERTRFLARMSHELRTPLNAIIGFSDVLAERSFGPLTTKQAEYVGDVVDSGHHLLSLVDDLLDVAKVETGALDLDLAVVEVGELLRGSVTLFKEQAGRRSIALELDVKQDVGRIDADQRRLRQVAFNLIANALKFTPDGGRICISAIPRPVGVQLAVEDSGPGVAPEDREAIFQEFHQADRAGAATPGTGLGLPLARRLVERHGGRLWVEEGASGGARFVADIPRRVPVPDEATDAPVPQKENRRILGEADSPERRQESARLIAILNLGVALTSVCGTVALYVAPEHTLGANRAVFTFLTVLAVGFVPILRWNTNVWGSPIALPFYNIACAVLFCIGAWALGPQWGQFVAPFYAWVAVSGVLAVGPRLAAVVITIMGIGHALALANQHGVVAPVGRWLVTMGYVVTTAVIYRRFMWRIQALTEANQTARAEAEDVGAQLALATRHKTDFLTNMSHELRTPLNAIIGFSEVLEGGAFGPLNDKQREYVADVLVSGRHLLTLINDILDLAKVDAGRMDLRAAPIDVASAITETVREFEALASARRVALEVDADALTEIRADEGKLREVVAKLVSNALNFTPTGGQITVTAARSGDQLEIAVSDTGPGVAREDRERIFEPFAQGELPGPLKQGSGLGLALARRYVELHGGTLDIDSGPDAGATFLLRIPCEPLAQAGTVR